MRSPSSFFADHPEKILGTLVEVPDRFGREMTVLHGTLTEAMASIQAPHVRRFDHFKAGKQPELVTKRVKQVITATEEVRQAKS